MLPLPLTAVWRRFAVGDCARYCRVDEIVEDLDAVLQTLRVGASYRAP